MLSELTEVSEYDIIPLAKSERYKLGPKMDELHADDLTFDRFIELFIAGLVSRGVVTLSPNAAETNIALYRVCDALERELVGNGSSAERKWIRRIRNQLSPSNLGTFDGFFGALRTKQLGYVASPNPSYKDINFKISPTYAKSLINELASAPRRVIDSVVSEFLGEALI